MATKPTLKRILWAVDAFEQKGLSKSRILTALKCLQKKSGATIEPVYVLSPAELNLSIEFTPPWITQYRPAAEAALKALVKALPFKALDGTVLVQHVASTRGGVEKLLDHARSTKADLIVSATHARKGFSRMFLGSFAETLILHSRVPVFTVNPHQKIRTECFEHILFPTDFGPHTASLLNTINSFAKLLGAKLTIYHAMPNPIEPFVQSGMFLLGGSWVPVHTYFAKDVKQRSEKLERLVNWSRKKGVKTEYFLDQAAASVSNNVLNFVEKKKVDLIAMSSRSGTMTSAIIGSSARQIVRHSPCPVWVVHSSLIKR